MTLEQLAKQGRRKEILTTAFTINESICRARNENLKRSFVDCEHIKNRNELVATRNGVGYINDSAAHSLSATWFSLESNTNPTVWITIAGDADYEEMIPVVREHVKAIICVGGDAGQVRDSLGYLVRNDVTSADSMEEAVRMAAQKSVPGYNVLFSPGCGANDEVINKMAKAFVKIVKE